MQKSYLAALGRRRKPAHLKARRSSLETLERRELLSTWTVISNADLGTGSTTNPSEGDLRYCITQADNDPIAGPEYIQFSIPGSTTIALTGPLPVITRPMTIDGTTETGYNGVPLIDLDATTLRAGQAALTISAGGGGSVIKALAIANSPGTAISILGNNLGHGASSGDDNVISGCYIGTFDGSTAKANASGIVISSSSGNTIGGTGVHAGNVISGNTNTGLTIGDTFTSNNNVVEDNYIGTNAAGTAALANGQVGIGLFHTSGDVISGNVVSGNTAQGIYINDVDGPCSSITLTQNFVGTNAAGTAALGNGFQGIRISGGSNITIGGIGVGNVVSGNGAGTGGYSGIRLDNDGSGASSQGIVIEGNKVGTDVTGTVAIPNTVDGIRLFDAVNTTIGGTAAGAGNLISGNTIDGIQIQNTSSGTVIQGNIIGLVAGGLSPLANTNYGIELLFGATGTVIDDGNVISGNTLDGISLGNSSLDSLVQGNYIGTDMTGNNALGNQQGGIAIEISSGNTIGGTGVGQGNVISGNDGAGIIDQGSSNNVFVGNLIGTNAAGLQPLGNTQQGIFILGGNGTSGASNDTIGGTAAGAGNVIGANGQDGIFIQDAGPSNVLIEGNYVGTNSVGANLGNGANGIRLFANQNTVGGTAAGAGNVIANNTGTNLLNSGNGIALVLNSIQNEFLSNSIYDDASLGINFGSGPTANHPWPPGVSPGSGPNNYQNYPVLTSAVTNGATNQSEITGTLNAAPSTNFIIQFFANPTRNESSYGEGEIYLGQTTVATDSNSNAAIDYVFTGSIPSGYSVSATATDPSGDTSEFAKDISSQAEVAVSIAASAQPSTGTTTYVGSTLVYTLTVTNSGSEDAQNVVVTDTLDPNVTYQSATSSVSGAVISNLGGGVITAQLGTVPAHTTATVTIDVTVNSGGVPQVTNDAKVATTDQNIGTPVEVVTSTTVLPAADLAISGLTATPDGVTTLAYAGTTVAYTISATNNPGLSTATNVVVTDYLPSNINLSQVTALASDPTATVVIDTTAGTVTATFPTVTSGTTVTLTVDVVPLAAAVNNPLATHATVFSTAASGTPAVFDPDLSNNTSSTLTTPITASADLAVTITPSATSVLAGGNVIYTITATNLGPNTSPSVQLTDTIPTDVIFVSADGGGVYDSSTDTITFPTQSLAAGASTTPVHVTVSTSGTTASPTSSTASVTDTSGVFDPNMSNNMATSAPVTITAVSNLSIGLQGSASSVYVGNDLTYTITATNSGPSAETNAVVTDTLDPNVTYISAASSVPGSLISFAAGVVTVNLGTLGVSSTATVTVVVAPLAAAAVPLTGTVSNTASITGQNYPNASPSQTITTTVNALADLAITSLQATANPLVEQPLVFTIIATNNGQSNATGVVLTDDLPNIPTDVGYVSATTSTGVVPTLIGNTVTADIGSLADGASVTMTITVTPTAAAVADSPLSDTATVNGAQENLGDNNSATITFSVSPAVDLVVGLSAAPNPVEIQTDLTYMATVQNTGPSDATNVSLIDTLPANVLFVSATGGVTPVGNVLTFNIGSLAVGASAAVQIVVSPTTAAVASPSLTNTINAQATQSLVNPSVSQASVTTTALDHVGTIELSSTDYAVTEDAGSASITVNRVDGLRGTVTVQYATVAQTAIPGIDYTPVSGTLTFAPGVASQTIVVPVLDNSYVSQNRQVSIVLSNVQTTIPQGQPGQAILGTPSTATLTIVVVNPNLTPLTVTNLQWTGTVQNIRELFVTFNKPLLPSTATDPINYTLINLGPDDRYGSLDNTVVQLGTPTYTQSIFTVTLTPTQPLPANQMFYLEINAASPSGVQDVGGNQLSGNGSTPGTNYTAMLARGTNLRYYDPSGDQVSLKITGGGIIDDWLSGTGQGIKLSVVDEVPHHTVLSGSLKRSRTSAGEAYLGYTLYGLGKFGDVRVGLHSPRFQVTRYTFSPGVTAASTASTAAVVNPDNVVASSAETRSVKKLLTKSAQKVSSKVGAVKTATKKLSSDVRAATMNRPFHEFRR